MDQPARTLERTDAERLLAVRSVPSAPSVVAFLSPCRIMVSFSRVVGF